MDVIESFDSNIRLEYMQGFTQQLSKNFQSVRVAGMGIVHVSAGPCGHSLIFLLIDAARAL